MKTIANKWSLLIVSLLCWTAAGWAMFGKTDRPETANAKPSAPQRIVSMAPNLTEILFALGLADRIVGVTADSNYPPAAAAKPVVGTFWQPNIEAIIAAGPDLVVTLGFDQQTNLAQRLDRLGYNTLTVNIEKVDHLFDAIGKIGAVTGEPLQAQSLNSRLQNNLDGISTLVAAGAKPKVLWIIQIEPLRVAGRDTFINEIIELAGGVNAIGSTINKYPPIGPEQVISAKPDVIIEPAMYETDLTVRRQQLIEHFSRFNNVGAVEHRRIYVIEGDTVCRLGPRIDTAVETVAGCIRPDLFKD